MTGAGGPVGVSKSRGWMRGSLPFGAQQFSGPQAQKRAGADALVRRLRLSHKLYAHEGCVNTVCFDDTGRWLLSGSDDKTVCVWSHEERRLLKRVHTSHTQNIFHAKLMPFSDCTLVSCAGDGTIQVCDITRLSQQLYSDNRNRVKKLATHPESPKYVSLPLLCLSLCPQLTRASQPIHLMLRGRHGERIRRAAEEAKGCSRAR